MRVSKKNHVTREYTVVIGDTAVTQDVTLNLINTSVRIGDVNGDGTVNSMDSYTLKLILAGVNVPNEDEKIRADVNGDGTVNSMDSYTLKLILAGVYKN